MAPAGSGEHGHGADDRLTRVPTVARPDLELFYERRGSGPGLLLCNGSGATIEGSGPLIGALAQHFEVAVPDQRCLGRTGVPATQPTMADYAADALALLDHLGWERVLVFGISFGGMIAQELAVTAPERIERLALLCTSPGGAGGSSYPLHELAALAPDERARVSLHNLDTRFTPEWMQTHPSDQALVEMMMQRALRERTPDEVRGEAMQLEARRHHDVWDRLPNITAPTSISAGRFDGLAPLANSEAIAARITGSEMRVYDGGHAFVFQDRRALPDIVEFLLR